jgi:hypothetical protein
MSSALLPTSKPWLKRTADLGDFFQDLLLLVDLDRINAPEIRLVVQLLDGLGERLVQQGNLGVEQILDAQQHRQAQAAFLQAADDGRDGHADILARKRRDA